MKVIELSMVAKMLRPATIQGIRWPPRKKSSVFFVRRENHPPTATIASR